MDGAYKYINISPIDKNNDVTGDYSKTKVGAYSPEMAEILVFYNFLNVSSLRTQIMMDLQVMKKKGKLLTVITY
jgi:hypothetical protein